MVDAGVPAPPVRTRVRPFAAFRSLSDRTPLRTKLITAVLAMVIVALTAISIASVYMVRTSVITQRDSQLQTVFNGVAANPTQILQKPPGYAYSVEGFPAVVAGVQSPGNPLGPPGAGFGLPSNLPGQSVPNVPTSQAWATANSGRLVTLSAQSGPDTWRVMVEPLTVNGQSVMLVVGTDVGNVGQLTHRLVLFDLIVGGAIVVILAAVGAAVIQANLRPLNDIELTAGQIARGHLNHRITELDPRTEIGSLGHSLNAMLSQIETAFHAQEESEQAAHESEERMRRFIADASHELRTPLTTIRGFAEYYRQRGGVPVNGHPSDDLPDEGLTPQDLDRIMHRLEAEASRMGLLVEDLLQLARIDQQRPLEMAPVDLLALAADAVQDARMVAPDRPIDLAVAPGAAFIVNGDEPRLRQVIGNLVNNALTHTPSGTPVRVRIGSGTLVPPAAGAPGGSGGSGGLARGSGAGRAAGGSGAGRAAGGRRPAGRPVPAVLLDVEDDGPGMTTEQAQHVFERFYRADQARNRASGGTGLGLAIVAGLVAAHGGTVSVRTAPGEGADFQVKLPLSPDAQDDDEPAEPEDEDSEASAR
jgi:two-component system, OmpR family, sensor kinase